MTTIQDEPINKVVGIQDGTIPDAIPMPSIEGQPLKDIRAAQAAVLKSEAQDISVLEAFSTVHPESVTKSGAAVRQEAATELHERTMVDARDLFYNQAITDNLPTEDTLTALNTVETIENEGKSRESFPINQYVDAIASPNLEPDRKEDLRTNLYLQDKLNELSQDVTGWEIAKDILLSVLIAPKDLFDMYQATGSVSPWQQEATYRKMAEWFQGLPNDEKIKMWPAVQEWVTDAMPRGTAVEFLAGLIDPAAAEGTADELTIFGSIDAALLGAGAVAGAFKLRKVLNPIKAGTRAGDYERSADANFVIMDNPDSAGALGIDELQANLNALPFDGEIIDDAVDSALSPAVHERIFQFRDRLKQQFNDMADAKTFTREGFLDTEDRARAQRRLTDEWEFYVKETYADQDKIAKLDSIDEVPDGMNFQFTVTNADGSEVKDTYKGKFTTDDIGFWQSVPNQSAWKSEKAQANNTDFMSTVNAAIRLDNTASAVATQLKSVIKDASKPIRGFKGKPKKVRIQEVDDILITGDDMTKEFTPQALKAGVNGIKLDEDQIEYYYNMRGVMNGLGILRNMDARRAMDARGVKMLNINDHDQFFGEVVDDAAAASQRVRGLNKVWKFDDIGHSVDVSDLNMGELYGEGYRLTRLEEDAILGGARYQHVLVKTEKLEPLPSVVLDLKRGYIPRVNPKATYFVQAFRPSAIDGVQDVARKAVRSFDNKADADKFASEIFARAEAEGFETGTTFRVVEDGELEAFKAGDSGAGQSGGLVYSPRARKPIPHNDGDSATVPRTSAMEAIELYLENTKNYMTRNDFRMGMRRKWEKTAEFKLGKKVSFEDGENIANTELKTLWDKIHTYSGFMDKSERHWEQTVKGVYEWSLSKFGRNRISDFILTQRQKDPAARLRSATFHSLLGMFNPVQLWVQAQGAAVAMGMNLTNPVRLQKVFRQQNALALNQHVNFDDSAKITKGIAKAAGFESVEEMKSMDALWKKSGLYDGVLSNADVEAAARGFPTSRNAVRRFADSGLMFFRAGELFNRRLAFLTAVDELGGPTKLASSDTLFKEALDRTNNLILNLGKANRAQWQKGALSIPLQFMQIQFKTIESILGLNGAFKGPEMAKMMFAQLALYGSAGVFGGTWALRQIANAQGIDQIDINNMDEGTLRSITGGFSDWFAYQMGAHVIVSDRGALLNGMDQTVLSLFTEEMSAFEWLFGPSSVAPTRFVNKWRQLSNMFVSPQDINGQVSFEASDVTDTLAFIGRGMGELASSPFSLTNQLNKAMLMQDLGVIRDKNGNLVAAPTNGFNWQTEWATAIGFKPELLQRKFDLSEINEETRQYVLFRSNMLVMNWDTFLQEWERARVEERDLDEDTLRQFRKRQNVLLNSISSPGVRQRVLESFQNRLTQRRQGNSQLDRQMQTYYENMLLDLAGEFTSADTRLIQTRETN
jgi:hypothetical protein